VEFVSLFHPEEGRMGVAVTFIAILELMREGLLEISQTEAFAPIHVRAADASRAAQVIDGTAAEVAAEDARLLEQHIDENADDEEPLE
jgi:segregation and condensation protein A